jgi:hypothetical protein
MDSGTIVAIIEAVAVVLVCLTIVAMVFEKK